VQFETRASLPLSTRDLLDPDPIEHLGWGTLEDVFVDLGGGAGVSLLSGNLVLRLEPLPRPDLPVGMRMALTYNHMEPEGASDLAPGWTYDLARFWMPGPWGERMLVDADGFRDSFWAGAPPSAEELDNTTRDVVDAWRRSTPRSDRRALGGVRALEELLVSDPSTLGSMRLRYLGAPEPDFDSDEIYRSAARGARTLLSENRSVVLGLPDGTREIYETNGALRGIEPAAGADWALNYNNGRLEAVVSAGITEWSIDTDSRFRMSRLLDAEGGVADFEYVGSQLQTVDAPAGTWRFRYDGRGRLTEANTPAGVVSVAYDDATGRVSQADGPAASVQISPTLSDSRLQVRVDGLAGGTFDLTWDAERRVRSVRRGGRAVEDVRFAPLAALPTDVELPTGRLTFDWDDTGRLRSASQDGREVRFDRAGGVLSAIVDGGGGRGVVEASASGISSWTDPAGRRTTLERADDGHIRAVGRTGGPDLSIKRHTAGALSLLSVREGAELILPAPERAIGEVRLDGASAGVRRDRQGRIVGFEGPAGRTVSFVLGEHGRIEEVRDDRTSSSLSYAGTLLSGWSGPEGSKRVRRDGDGLASALIEGGTRWDVRRGGDGGIDRLLVDDAELLVETDPNGGLRAWQRPGGARTTLQRDGQGSVSGRDDTAAGELVLERDRGGRVIGVRRDTGRWSLGRDRSGRVQRVAEPGGSVDFTLDDAGRPRSLSSLSGHSWTVQRDAVGRLVGITGSDATFAVDLTRSGAPQRFVRPDSKQARLDFDVRGRWTGMGLPEGALSVSWGVLGPTSFGELRWRLDSVGALVGWGLPEDGHLRWQADRESDGRVRRVRGTVVERGIKRLPDGRQSQVGDVALTWGAGGIEGIETDSVQWRLQRDGAGRVRAAEGPAGSYSVDRERTGDARQVTATRGDRTVVLELARDPAGRLVGLTESADGRTEVWRLARDPMGRLVSVEQRGGAAARADITWRDIARDEEGVLAQALAVQTDDPRLRREASGAWDAAVGDGGAPWARFESRPSAGGRHGQAYVVPRELSQHLPPSLWDELPFPAAVEPPHMLHGDAARAQRWWAGWAPRAEHLALMPEGIPESVRAWRHARVGARAVAAGIPEDAGRAGAGVLLPAVPGASSLVPGPMGARRVSATEAMVLSGDLPEEALLWSDLLDLPSEPWTFDLPGAAVLAALRPRLAHPSLPPMGGGDTLAVVQAGAHGLLTRRGRDQERRRSWDVGPLVEGLPPGTADVLPGTPGWVTAHPGTTAADGRASGIDGLSDDPLGVREAALSQARSDSILLALHALSAATPTSLGGTLPDSADGESWLIELPTGTRVVVDGHGRLLSLDAGGRLMRSLVGAMAELASGELLAPTLSRWELSSGDDDSPWIPNYLPGRGEAVESRWGLVPAVPGMPLDAQGRPSAPGWPR